MIIPAQVTHQPLGRMASLKSPVGDVFFWDLAAPALKGGQNPNLDLELRASYVEWTRGVLQQDAKRAPYKFLLGTTTRERRRGVAETHAHARLPSH